MEGKTSYLGEGAGRIGLTLEEAHETGGTADHLLSQAGLPSVSVIV